MTGLVLLHGFTGCPDSFGELVGSLHRQRARLRVLRPALLGHGASAEPGGSGFEGEVERLAREIRGARFEGAYLCGYSLGARLALGLLARHARLFRGATLIGVHPGLGSDAERAARVGSDERWCELLARRGLASFLDAWQAQALFATQAQLPPARLARQRELRERHSAAGLQQSLRAVGLGRMPDLRGVLYAQPLRVRLLVGALDAKFLALAQQLAASGRAKLDCLSGVGHNVPLEAPEPLARMLIQALEAS